MRHLLDFQDVDKRHLEKLIEVTKTSEAKAENLDSLAILKFDDKNYTAADGGHSDVIIYTTIR